MTDTVVRRELPDSHDEHDRGGVPAAPSSLRRAWPISWRSVGLWLGAYAVLTLVWTAVGLFIVRQVDGTNLHEVESDIARWFEAQRTPTLNDVSRWISFSGDAVPKTILIALLAATFIAIWGRTHEALFLVAVMGVEVAVFATTSTLVGRDRPPVEQLDGSLPTSSFPSGHVAASFALYGALAVIIWWRTRNRAVRATAALFAVAWPVLMVVIRLYRGMHYVSDTLMGALLGIASIGVGLTVVCIGNRALAARRDDLAVDDLALDRSGYEERSGLDRSGYEQRSALDRSGYEERSALDRSGYEQRS